MAVMVQVAKWGDGLGVRVPRAVADRIGLTEGAHVDIETSADGKIVISKSRRGFTLEELVAGMTPEREHVLEDDGPEGEEML
jgi:antitoxin MazE